MKTITIVGAGFAGLALAWHLKALRGDSLHINVFDPTPGKGGASSIAAGLLHTFGGMDARKSSIADEAYQLSLALIKQAERYTCSSPFITKEVLRVALSERQKQAFALAASKYPLEARYLNEEQTTMLEPAIQNAPSLYIPNAVAVDTPVYLDGLVSALQEKGVEFIKETFPLSHNNASDTTVFACGASIFSTSLAEKLRLKPLKGQLLTFTMPDNAPSIKRAINSKVYILPYPNKKIVAGSTFEKNIVDPCPDIAIAKEKILPELTTLLPALKGIEASRCQAAIRVTSPDHKPVAIRISEHLWYFGALGSKGLLLHAYYAKKLAQTLCQ